MLESILGIKSTSELTFEGLVFVLVVYAFINGLMEYGGRRYMDALAAASLLMDSK